jgi:septin 6/8/11
LMDSLFNTNFEATASPHSLPSVKLKAQTYELQESNVRLKLTICDTVGYGDQINKDDSFKAVVDHLDAQFEAYLQEELKIKRSLSAYHDSRIHICLYFICPTGHGLKSLDLVCMKKLDTKVNIIPIIAKADTISKTELQKFKVGWGGRERQENLMGNSRNSRQKSMKSCRRTASRSTTSQPTTRPSRRSTIR